MGEYADYTIENELNYHIDEMFDDSDDLDFNSDIPVSLIKEIDCIEFSHIKKETDKAWLVVMTGKAEIWFPKSKCWIIGNKVDLPIWLRNKMAGW
jgi:hypothetical protein